MKNSHFIFLAACAILLIAPCSFSQNTKTAIYDGYKKNIFIEGLGSSLIVGINYDMRLQRGKTDGVGFRAGIGYAPMKSYIMGVQDYNGMALSFPIEANYLFGKRKNYVLAGVGILPIYADVKGASIFSGKYSAKGFTYGATYLSLGYRYQPIKNGLMFQINWNPMIDTNGHFQAKWFGISIGYSLR